MKKDELKSGAIVELRNGDKYILLLNTKPTPLGCNNLLISLDNGGYLDFDSEYKKDLTHINSCFTKNKEDYDIMKVCQKDYVGNNFRLHKIVKDIYIRSRNYNYWTWERKEHKKALKMTLKEVCEELGYDVEIVKEEEDED